MYVTFLFRFTENGILFINGHQSDVIIIYDVLRVFKAIVSAQKVADGYHLHRTESVDEKDIKNLSRSLIVVWQASFTHFPSCAIEFPADILDRDVHQPQQLEENSRYKLPGYQQDTWQRHCFSLVNWKCTTENQPTKV